MGFEKRWARTAALALGVLAAACGGAGNLSGERAGVSQGLVSTVYEVQDEATCLALPLVGGAITWDAATATCRLEGGVLTIGPEEAVVGAFPANPTLEISPTAKVINQGLFIFTFVNSYGSFSNQGEISSTRLRNLGGTLENSATWDDGSGIVYNTGTFNNSGRFVAHLLVNTTEGGQVGVLHNHGTLIGREIQSSGGELINHPDGVFENYGLVQNEGTFRNHGLATLYQGTFANRGLVDNFGTIHDLAGDTFLNFGTFFNHCGAVFTGLYQGNPPVDVCTPPAPTIEELISEIEAMGLSKGLETALTAPLRAAAALLNDDEPRNDRAACAILSAFIAHVEARAGRGLTEEQAQRLAEQARAIQTQVCCGLDER